MEIEFEATFPNISKDEMRSKLKEAGATLKREEFMQKRIVLNLPKGHEIKGGWLRVRDEGDKITMSLKVVDGDQIHNQKEICLNIDNLKQAELFLTSLGCEKKAYQETKRELWLLDGVEVTIDEWPFLEPFLEVESTSEEKVKTACEKLNLNYKEALFCSVDTLYAKKYNITNDVFNNHSPEILFNGKNPFL